MSLIRKRVYRLLEKLSDAELEVLWPTLEALYLDFYTLEAIQAAQQTFKPGDTLTREEALRFLSLS